MNPLMDQLLAKTQQLLKRNGDAAMAQRIDTWRKQPAAPSASSSAADGEDAGDVIDVDVRVVDVDVDVDVGAPQAPQPSNAAAATQSPTSLRGSLEAGIYSHRFGTRHTRLYLPRDASRAPRGLILMLHGCTQDADDFARGTAMAAYAEQFGFGVIYPSQSAKANTQRCWNWFSASQQQRGSGECALLADLALDTAAAHGIDAARIYVAGLSAGGAMAAVLAHAYPNVFAGAGVHSGLPVGAASNVQGALAAMRSGPTGNPTLAEPKVRTITFHGTGDTIVSPANAAWPAPTSLHTQERREGPSAISTRADGEGRVRHERWLIDGAPHAWSGGRSSGTYTHPSGPDASREVVRFFGLDAEASD